MVGEEILQEKPRRFSGLWNYLINRDRVRGDITKDVERNKLNIRYLHDLPPGVTLTDSEDVSGARTFSLTPSQHVVVFPMPQNLEVQVQPYCEAQPLELPDSAGGPE
jgi:hypothetical protein